MNAELKDIYVRSGGEIKEFEKLSGEIEVGYKIEYKKKISEVDVFMFGLISGDFNPVHFDEDVAARTKFGGRVVHGMLTTSLVSAAIARMPGIVVLLEACFRYTKPVRIGDIVRVVGEVIEKERNRFKLDVKCFVGDEVVAEGCVKALSW